MKKIYINGLSCISAQPTFSGDFLSKTIENTTDTVRYAVEPSYKDHIPPAAIRRMAKSVKMGIMSAVGALKDAQIDVPSAIFTGTGAGCLQDSEKFLSSILDNEEQYLTPTSFIQSTHNTVAGQIALNLQCKGTNLTYVNGAISFETAMMKAQMQIELNDENHILVGAVDETAPYTVYLYELVDIIKHKNDSQFAVFSDSKGVIFSEGATFFVLSGQKVSNTYAMLTDVSIYNRLESDMIQDKVKEFLLHNGLSVSDVSVAISGRNGDCQEAVYFDAFEEMFPHNTLYYKHLSGEYYTASAFGVWVACQILKRKEIPSALRGKIHGEKCCKYILLYNQFQGRDHSFVLLSNV